MIKREKIELKEEDLKPEWRGIEGVEFEEKLLNKAGTRPVTIPKKED